jgi:RNA polymerase sigma-70 factor (ECF subfamily)
MTDGGATRRSQAFRAAITPLIDVAYRVLRRLGVPDGEIDDALQSVLVVAHRRFDEIEAGKLKAFIYATCANVARDLGRRRSRAAARTTAMDAAEDTPASELGPEDALDCKQALAIGERILASMDDELRIVFVLYELEELTGPEIAEQLGVPVGTVASRLRRARKLFREALALADTNEDELGSHRS